MDLYYKFIFLNKIGRKISDDYIMKGCLNMSDKNMEISSIINKSNPSTMDYYRFIQLVDKDHLIHVTDEYECFFKKMFLKQDSKNELFAKLLNNLEYFYRDHDDLLVFKTKLVLLKTLYVKWRMVNL